MSELNKDVLLLIFEELQYDRKSLHSCLLVKRSWCEVIIPILWKDHTKYLKKIKKSLNIIISHLPNETKEKLKSRGIDISTTQKKPLFNYIGFCRYLDLYGLKKRISSMANIDKSQIPILSNEILKLFINRNTSITHLLIPKQCDYQIHLIPGAEICFSELKFLQCRTNTSQKVLEGLAKICKSVKKLELDLAKSNNNRGVSKLIEAQINLVDVCLTCYLQRGDVSFCKSLEESLIRHADSVQNLRIDWYPLTKILLCFVNLVSLEINIPHFFNIRNSSHICITNACLPLLKILKVRSVQSEHLASLIKNTKGHLTDINILYEGYDNGMLIQAIYQNCPNLTHLQLSFYENNISSELGNLLINCRNLNGLVITIDDWENIFKILNKSSPIGLFNFKFYLYSLSRVRLEPLEIFFNDWEGKHPMSLQIVQSFVTGDTDMTPRYLDLIEQYKVKGVIEEYKVYNVDWMRQTFDNFEWDQKNVGSI